MEWKHHLKELERMRDSTRESQRSRQAYAHGGSIQDKMKVLASEGRYGDTRLAEIGPRTARVLDQVIHGGHTEINPRTSLREYPPKKRKREEIEGENIEEIERQPYTRRYLYNPVEKKHFENPLRKAPISKPIVPQPIPVVSPTVEEKPKERNYSTHSHYVSENFNKHHLLHIPTKKWKSGKGLKILQEEAQKIADERFKSGVTKSTTVGMNKRAIRRFEGKIRERNQELMDQTKNPDNNDPYYQDNQGIFRFPIVSTDFDVPKPRISRAITIYKDKPPKTSEKGFNFLVSLGNRKTGKNSYGDPTFDLEKYSSPGRNKEYAILNHSTGFISLPGQTFGQGIRKRQKKKESQGTQEMYEDI